MYSDDDSEDEISDLLGMDPYQYEPVGLSQSAMTESGSDEDKDEVDRRLGNISWYALVANRVLIAIKVRFETEMASHTSALVANVQPCRQREKAFVVGRSQRWMANGWSGKVTSTV